MKRIVLVALVVFATLGAAQAWDFEAGREIALTEVGQEQSWYFKVRYNLPLSSEVLGTQLWALPEFGVWVPDQAPYHGYVRLQFLVDQTFGALFTDIRAGYPAGPDRHQVYALLRFGIRFGWPP